MKFAPGISPSVLEASLVFHTVGDLGRSGSRGFLRNADTLATPRTCQIGIPRNAFSVEKYWFIEMDKELMVCINKQRK